MMTLVLFLIGLMGRLIHLLRSEDADVQNEILAVTRKHFAQGGSRRIPYTLPAIIVQGYQLALKYSTIKDKVIETRFSFVVSHNQLV